jgi:hypothetical protein
MLRISVSAKPLALCGTPANQIGFNVTLSATEIRPMTDEYEKHAWRAKLTFRQAEGLDPMPQVLKWGELSRELRLEIHDVFTRMFQQFTQQVYDKITYTVSFRTFLED